MDDDVLLWLVGAVALVVVVAAFVWVLRHRGDAERVEAHPSYDAPEIMTTGGRAPAAMSFGAGESEGEETVDQTVPLSRLGGAGWRDGGSAPVPETTTTPYAGEPGSRSADRRTWAEEPQEWPDPDATDSSAEGGHHVAVEDSGPRPAVDEELDRERGGHW